MQGRARATRSRPVGAGAWSNCTLDSAPVRLLCLLRARLAALGSPALAVRGRPTGRLATASAARASHLQSCRLLPLHNARFPFRNARFPFCTRSDPTPCSSLYGSISTPFSLFRTPPPHLIHASLSFTIQVGPEHVLKDWDDCRPLMTRSLIKDMQVGLPCCTNTTQHGAVRRRTCP